MNVQLFHGDCLDVMKTIPDGSVDMVLCDPPFGTIDCAWDNVIPIDALWEQYRRIIKRKGVICLFGSEPFSTRIRMAALDLFKYDWIWEKTTCTGFTHAKNMPLKNHEIISIFSYSPIGHKSTLGERRMPYNPQGITVINAERGGGLKKFGNVFGNRPSHKDRYVQEGTGYPKSVLHFEQMNSSSKERLHPSQKPVPLLEYLIRTYTNPGDMVLDNCMGSGSTGVACVNTGRNFIGIELEGNYFEIAKKRIDDTHSQMDLFT